MAHDIIADMPKAELHMHIEGSIEPAMLLELARRNGVDLPFADEAAVQQAYEFANLQAFLDIYYKGLTVMRTAEDFESVTFAYLQRAAADRIRHTEMFISPQAHLKRDISMDAVMRGIRAAMQRGEVELGVHASLILVIQRQFSEDDARATLEAAMPWRDDFIGLGLGGPEVGNPPRKFRRLYDEARAHGLHTVAHAGEEGGPDYIWQALDELGVERIDHGVRAIEDAALVRALAERGTPLTVCPLSNVCLKVFPDLASHSLKKLFEAGVHVTINTDDPPYFGGYLNTNYEQCRDSLVLTDAQIYDIARNGFTAAFLPDAARTAYLDELAAHRSVHGVA